jgi:serine/threonine-protein kinase
MSSIPEQIGRYKVIERVGRGGMGVLYRAHDAALERDVAVKMMHLDFTSDSHARERFQREARAVARLQHPNIVTIHELGEFDDTPFIVMEFLAGKDLEALLKDGTQLTLGRKVDIAAQLCEGLAFAHDQGIVHRDIKPGNVRVLEDGKVKILDFGIARFAASSLTQSGTVMGTPSYMAPEQIMGQPVDGRADLFSAGVLFYELLSGHKPFTGESPTAVAYSIMNSEPPELRQELTDLPDAINEIVSRALRKNPNERYGHAREMASDLQTVRMMLDLPLSGSPTLPASATTTVIAKSDLFATALQMPGPRPAAPQTGGLGDIPMRASAEAALADAAPSSGVSKKSGPSMGLIAGLVGAGLVVAWLGMTFLSVPDTPEAVDVDGAAAGGAVGATPPPGGSPSPVAGADAGAGAAAAAPLPAAFRVESAPAGASITIDGVDTGLKTPADVPLTGAMPATIALALAGHDTLSADISRADLEAGTKRYSLAVAARAVRLTVSASYPFELVSGSRVISEAATSHDVTVNPGASVSARNGALLLNDSLALNFRSASGRQSITLDELGMLAIFGNSSCSVVVGGRDLGQPPIPPMRVATGRHTVVLKCEGAPDKTERADVKSGEQVTVRFTGDEPHTGGQSR